MGSSLEATAGETFVDWSRKTLGAADIDVATTLLRTHGISVADTVADDAVSGPAMPLVTRRLATPVRPAGQVAGDAAAARERGAFILSGNPFGDAGMTALADAAAHGALRVSRSCTSTAPRWATAAWHGSQRQQPAAAVAAAAAEGVVVARCACSTSSTSRATPWATRLAALGDALARGAFPRLATLYLYNNQIGSRGLAALVRSAEAGADDGGASAGAGADADADAPLARLEKLYVDNNQVGEEGLSARRARSTRAARLAQIAAPLGQSNPAAAGGRHAAEARAARAAARRRRRAAAACAADA